MKKPNEILNLRIRKIELTDFRNIVHAEINIPSGKIEDYTSGEPSILGLYGQNGSGKTSLLLALAALKTALTGSAFYYSDYIGCIRIGCNTTNLSFEFSAYNKKGDEYDIYYSFALEVEDTKDFVVSKNDKKTKNPTSEEKNEMTEALDIIGVNHLFSDQGMDALLAQRQSETKRIVVKNEVLQFAGSLNNGEKWNKQVLIDTSEKAKKTSGKAFGNRSKYDLFTSNSVPEIDSYFDMWKMEATIKSTSFIFAEQVVKALIEGSEESTFKVILDALVEYGDNYLFVIMTESSGINNLNMFLPLSIWINTKQGAIGYTYPIKLKELSTVPVEIYSSLEKTVTTVSDVLSCIVPGLSIQVENYGEGRTELGKKVKTFDLVSVRNGTKMPLAYEADGIRRIVSFMSLIIAAYNDPSVTVAIDEIDSGIFEYMLGELLSILKLSARGQLIFTSHNLRPLEVLPHKNLLFTTTNPNNRFAKLEGFSGNNNLRDKYLKTVTLGGGKESYYDDTDSFSIEKAMLEAGFSQED